MLLCQKLLSLPIRGLPYRDFNNVMHQEQRYSCTSVIALYLPETERQQVSEQPYEEHSFMQLWKTTNYELTRTGLPFGRSIKKLQRVADFYSQWNLKLCPCSTTPKRSWKSSCRRSHGKFCRLEVRAKPRKDCSPNIKSKKDKDAVLETVQCVLPFSTVYNLFM